MLASALTAIAAADLFAMLTIFAGSARQAIHNLAGAVEYIGGGFALMTIARELGQPFEIAGFIVLGTAIGLSIIASSAGRGIVQRIAQICLFGGLALAAWRGG